MILDRIEAWAIASAVAFTSCCSCCLVGPRTQPGRDSCDAACAHLVELGCPEGKPLPDGTSCGDSCRDTVNQGHALNPACVQHITSCEGLASDCAAR